MDMSEFPLPDPGVAPGTLFSWATAPAAEYCGNELLRQRSMLREYDVERAVLLCCCGFGGMTPDKEMFRGRLKSGTVKGFSLALTEEVPCSMPAFRIWRFLLTGAGDPGYCSGKISRISGKIPLPGWLKISSPSMEKDVILASLQIIDGSSGFHPASGEAVKLKTLMLEASVFCGLPGE